MQSNFTFSGEPIPVAVLGATGSVGQRFIELLVNHPWFQIVALTASDRSAGKAYGDAVQWVQTSTLPPEIAKMVVRPTTPVAAAGCRVAFSALGSSVADEAEVEFARAGLLVVSNASSHRMDSDVPLLVPEVNPDHLALAEQQEYGQGVILTNPNCSTIGLTLALKPLDDAFGIRRAHVVSMQALSGAGIPGVSSMQAIDNVIPYIGNEEDKLETEPQKILGGLSGLRIEPHSMRIGASCNRVPVLDGHTLCISVELKRKVEAEDIVDAWRSFSAEPQDLDLPTAPLHPVHVLEAPDAPQPRLHRDLDKGMAASVGRLRPCPLFDWKFVTLSHNTIRGAAGGALLVAELAVARGFLD